MSHAVEKLNVNKINFRVLVFELQKFHIRIVFFFLAQMIWIRKVVYDMYKSRV